MTHIKTIERKYKGLQYQVRINEMEAVVVVADKIVGYGLDKNITSDQSDYFLEGYFEGHKRAQTESKHAINSLCYDTAYYQAKRYEFDKRTKYLSCERVTNAAQLRTEA